MKRLITLFSMICALVCAVSCSSPQSTPSAVVEQQLKAMKSGDAEKIAELFYFEEDKAEEGKQMITGLMTKLAPTIEKKGGIDSYEITSEKINESGEKAKVYYTVTYGNGEVEEQDADTIFKNDKWYLHFTK